MRGQRRIRGVSVELQQAAWELRDDPTPAEAFLWEALKGRRLKGLKFRRQHPVAQFVLDFFCPEQRLVVEVDGGVHTDTRERDAARTEELERLGYRVLRLGNADVLNRLDWALDRIAEAAGE